MDKTKLGLSYGLTASLCYLSAIISVLFAGLLMGFVLYFEENENLRFNALQAFVFALFMGIISQVVYLIPIPYFIEGIARGIITGFEIIVLLYAGIKCSDNERVNLPIASKWIDKHF